MTTPEPRTPVERPVGATERQAFADLAAASVPAVREAVQAWRTGLTALITLVTTGVVVTGRQSIAELPAEWRALVTVAIGGGLLLAVAGLWQALAAEVGDRVRVRTIDEIHERHASVAAFQVSLAVAAGRRLAIARALATGGLALILLGVIVTWWAPPKAAPNRVSVTWPGGTACGALLPAPPGTVRLAGVGGDQALSIALDTITGVAPVSSCPGK